jgi:hypothetical protein
MTNSHLRLGNMLKDHLKSDSRGPTMLKQHTSPSQRFFMFLYSCHFDINIYIYKRYTVYIYIHTLFNRINAGLSEGVEKLDLRSSYCTGLIHSWTHISCRGLSFMVLTCFKPRERMRGLQPLLPFNHSWLFHTSVSRYSNSGWKMWFRWLDCCLCVHGIVDDVDVTWMWRGCDMMWPCAIHINHQSKTACKRLAESDRGMVVIESSLNWMIWMRASREQRWF